MLLLLDLAYVAPVSEHFSQSLVSVNLESSLFTLSRLPKFGHDISPLLEDVLGKRGATDSCLHLASHSVVVARVELEESFLELQQVLWTFLLELLDDSHDLIFLLLLGDHVLQ